MNAYRQIASLYAFIPNKVDDHNGHYNDNNDNYHDCNDCNDIYIINIQVASLYASIPHGDDDHNDHYNDNNGNYNDVSGDKNGNNHDCNDHNEIICYKLNDMNIYSKILVKSNIKEYENMAINLLRYFKKDLKKMKNFQDSEAKGITDKSVEEVIFFSIFLFTRFATLF
jgi:hypothetical protein